MPLMSYQTVRLSPGRHRSQSAGVCVMELASMLADEPFSDRSRSVSPVIGAFLRTYNDGLDDDRRQDLYAVAAAVVGTRARPAIERERVNRCLAFARGCGGEPARGRAALAMASPEAAGTCAAQAVLRRGPTPHLHRVALAFVDELIALRTPPRRPLRWPAGAQPGRRVAEALAAPDAGARGLGAASDTDRSAGIRSAVSPR